MGKMGIPDKDEPTELEKIRLERDEAVRARDRLREEVFQATELIFRLNFREEEIRQERAQA